MMIRVVGPYVNFRFKVDNFYYSFDARELVVLDLTVWYLEHNYPSTPKVISQAPQPLGG